MYATVLQHIVLNGDPRFTGLYSVGDHSYPVQLNSGETLDIRAHFNYVPAGKLGKFTAVSGLSLMLDFDGDLTVECHRMNDGSDIVQILEPDNGIPVVFDHSDSSLIGFVLRAGPSGCVFRSGKVIAYSEEIKSVNLALVICTYRKEIAVKEKIVRFKSSEVYNGIKIIVVDNGNTLKDSENGITLLPSPNYGGSSGYAKGMIECLDDGSITHIILNDDDAELDPETVFRTKSFYSLITDSMEDAVLGGTMLLSEKPSVVHESGALFRSTYVHSLCHDLDISKKSDNLALSLNEDSEYFGWWYFVIPTDTVKKVGLPLPMFLKYDDVEYGLRIDSPKVTLCGISVWHPGFRTKFSEMSAYYSFRNVLITGSVHRSLTKKYLRTLFRDIEIDIAGYRYLTAKTKLKAAEDFLKGPDEVFRMCTDGPWITEEYQSFDTNALKKDLDLIDHAPIRSAALRTLSVNGLFSRPAGNVILDFFEPRTSEFYRIGNIIYTLDDGSGIKCSRDRKCTLTLIFKIIRLKIIFWYRFDKISEQYANSLGKYSSKKFWSELLNLDD